MTSSPQIRVRRVYEPAEPADGVRVLVDRLWPRGLSHEAAAIDHWCRAVAPSNDLRRWYGHDPDHFADFETRYREELRDPERAAALAALVGLCERGTTTLLTASRAVDISQATVLQRVLTEGAGPTAP